jgi:ABC-type phosphate transport system substrate-binding protein
MRRAFVVLFIAAAASLVATVRATDLGYVIVVNAANPVTTLSRGEVSNLFLKRSTTWSSGQGVVIPLDQRTDSAVRQAFSKDVHRKDASDIASYWNQMIFSGRATPPFTKSNDADVVAYVRANANAIGYVAEGAPLGEGVKALKLHD